MEGLTKMSAFFLKKLSKEKTFLLLMSIGNAVTGLVSKEEGPKAYLPFLPQTKV